MSVFDKDDNSLLEEEEARLLRHLNRGTGAKPKPAPVVQRNAVNTIKPANTQPSPAPATTSNTNVPEWKRQQLEAEQRERERQEQLEREKLKKLSSLPSADEAPEVNYISPVAPVSAVEAMHGKRPDAYCNRCGKGIGPGDMFCPNCGERCDVTKITTSAPKPRFCSDCGTKIDAPGQQGHRFCSGCGRNVGGASGAPASAPAPAPVQKDNGIGISVFGDEQNEGAREAARLNNVVDKPGIWVQNQTANLVIIEEPKQPDGWIITLSRIPASPDKPILLQVGMPNPITVFQGGDGLVSTTLTAPISKPGRIPFTLEVPKLPFQIRKPFDSNKGHYIKIALNVSDIIFSQSINPFPQ